MFRSAASLLAKKTAIVAITGVTVIGGATLALAADHLVDPGQEEITVEESCDLAETTDIVETCPEPETPENCDLAETTDIVETCPEPETPENCDLAETTDIIETCPEPETKDDGTDADADLEDEVVDEHPENHGKYVSEAAKGGGECAGMTGKAKGQCVSGVARSDAGKKGAEAPVEAPAAPVVTDAPIADAPAADSPADGSIDSMTAPEKPGKGNGNAGGKGKKG